MAQSSNPSLHKSREKNIHPSNLPPITEGLRPKSETNIPVSCVEQGRWSYRTKHFGSQSVTMSANLRNRKSVSLGNDSRMESERLVGSGLEFEDNVIQKRVFSSGNGSSPGSRMRRASVRRENRNM